MGTTGRDSMGDAETSELVKGENVFDGDENRGD